MDGDGKIVFLCGCLLQLTSESLHGAGVGDDEDDEGDDEEEEEGDDGVDHLGGGGGEGAVGHALPELLHEGALVHTEYVHLKWCSCMYKELASTLLGNARVWLEFSHLRKAEDGGEDPRHDKIDARQLLAELDERSQRECQRAQTLN